MATTIRFSTFPQTVAPPIFVEKNMTVFRSHESEIATKRGNSLKSNAVLTELRDDLVALGFDVEGANPQQQRIERPVFFGENGIPTVKYRVDAYHPEWECGLEVEAGRAWMGNAVYRDLIQTAVMVQVKYLVLAVPNSYKYKAAGKPLESLDYEHSRKLAEVLYGHSRLRMPYDLILVGY